MGGKGQGIVGSQGGRGKNGGKGRKDVLSADLNGLLWNICIWKQLDTFSGTREPLRLYILALPSPTRSLLLLAV